MKKNIQKIQRSIESSLMKMQISAYPRNDFKWYNTFKIWVILTAPKKVYQEAAPFPGGLSQTADFAENASTSRGLCYMPCFGHLFTTTSCPFGTLGLTETHLQKTTIFTSIPNAWTSSPNWRGECIDFLRQRICDQSPDLSLSEINRCFFWFQALFCKVKEPLARFGMILFHCCDMLWSFITLQSARVRARRTHVELPNATDATSQDTSNIQ